MEEAAETQHSGKNKNKGIFINNNKNNHFFLALAPLNVCIFSFFHQFILSQRKKNQIKLYGILGHTFSGGMKK